MIKINRFVLAFTLLVFTCSAFAQGNCDPWITAIYKQLYNRQPTSSECNIQNYNKGSWSSYQQLTDYIKSYQGAGDGTQLSSSLVSGDPWIMEIYQKLYGRRPNSLELNIKLYNNGNWSSYEQLSGFIQQFQKSLTDNGLIIETALLNSSHNLVAIKKDGVYIAANILENKGGNVVAAGGANVVAAGGANVVSAGGANVVAAGGGNVVAAGGGNVIAAGGLNARGYRVSNSGGQAQFQVSSSLLGASFGSGYAVQSGANLQIRTSGNGSLIFK
jgi:hypothetical protein